MVRDNCHCHHSRSFSPLLLSEISGILKDQWVNLSIYAVQQGAMTKHRCGLKELCQVLFRMGLPKDADVMNSPWSSCIELTPRQRIYAATDAMASLQVNRAIERNKDPLLNPLHPVHVENGKRVVLCLASQVIGQPVAEGVVTTDNDDIDSHMSRYSTKVRDCCHLL